jgi:EmrB/QacA subfamily drug resistance transporter
VTNSVPAPCDAMAAACARYEPGEGGGYVLSASVLGSSLAFVDGSVVNVALPAIEAGLRPVGAQISWALTAYLIPLGALTLLGGAMGDHFGRRKLFLGGIAIFVVASLVCAGAPTFPIFIAGRALQGIGAAMLMPNSLAMLGAAFDGERRASAIATWAAAGALAGAIGPLLGGMIVDHVGWRAIFLVNVPLGAAAAWLAAGYVAETRDIDAGKKVDWSGSLTATAALACLTWSLTAAAESGSSAKLLLGSFAAAALFSAAFVTIERAKGNRALVPPSICAAPTFVGLTLLTLFLYAALGGLTVLLPFLLIRFVGYSASAAAAALLPIPVIIGLGSGFVARFTGSIEPRRLLAGGSLAVAGGLLPYVMLPADHVDYWRDVMPGTLLIALGMTLCVAPLTNAVMNSVDSMHIGAASGLNSATARVGGLVATALLAFVFARQDSREQLIEAFRIAAVVGAVISAAAAASALLLIRLPSMNARS